MILAGLLLAAATGPAPTAYTQTIRACVAEVNRSDPRGFEGYLKDDGVIATFGTDHGQWLFVKCMHDRGYGDYDPVS